MFINKSMHVLKNVIVCVVNMAFCYQQALKC